MLFLCFFFLENDNDNVILLHEELTDETYLRDCNPPMLQVPQNFTFRSRISLKEADVLLIQDCPKVIANRIIATLGDVTETKCSDIGPFCAITQRQLPSKLILICIRQNQHYFFHNFNMNMYRCPE